MPTATRARERDIVGWARVAPRGARSALARAGGVAWHDARENVVACAGGRGARDAAAVTIGATTRDDARTNERTHARTNARTRIGTDAARATRRTDRDVGREDADDERRRADGERRRGVRARRWNVGTNAREEKGDDVRVRWRG